MGTKYFSRLKALRFFLLFSFLPVLAKAQSANEKFYRVTIGGGIGTGYPQTDGVGIGGLAELAYQQKKQVFAVGVNGISEFKIFDDSNVQNAVQSISLTYGRAFMSKDLFMSVNGGLGFVSAKERGALLSYTGFIFGKAVYEKKEKSGLGLALSANLIGVSPFIGAGLELYANVNGQSTFGGINLCFQFGKLKKKEQKK